jgi:hypothetical protein
VPDLTLLKGEPELRKQLEAADALPRGSDRLIAVSRIFANHLIKCGHAVPNHMKKYINH